MQRRDLLRAGLAMGGSTLLAPTSRGADKDLLKCLCPPDGDPPYLAVKPSPASRPFVSKLKIMPIKQPVARLDPLPDPRAHQRYNEFPPKKSYAIYEQEFKWVYHPDAPYNSGTWSWGFDGITPGPTFHARYGEPMLVRRFNNLPPVGASQVKFALPSTTMHLHNAHTASESDGHPLDWIDSGEFWDHHYGCFPAGLDDREKLATLWYHDRRLDFSAANMYAGLKGLFLLFDERDSGNENDPDAQAWRLPSGNYDIPLILHDLHFDASAQLFFDTFNTDGILGDKFAVNGAIQPYLEVEPRKYRFRILNGSLSRFYQLFLHDGRADLPFVVLGCDEAFLPEPVLADSLYLSVAQRGDVVVDFSRYRPGDTVTLVNRLEQTNGKGPTERLLEPGDGILQFHILEKKGPDNSHIPDRFRELPEVDMALVNNQRTWAFSANGGLWTINGQVMASERIDTEVKQGDAEIWTLRNEGSKWTFPVHSHFVNSVLLEVNGRPLGARTVLSRQRGRYEFAEAKADRAVPAFMGGQRRDGVTLFPNDEVKVYMRFRDFLGKYLTGSNNAVHADHGMQMRWDIVPAVFALALALAAATPALAQDCPNPNPANIACLKASQGSGHPYPQPRPAESCMTTANGAIKVITGQGCFPASNPFLDPPGSNLLPNADRNLFDAAGKEIPNTLPSTPRIPYNLQDGEPRISRIDRRSPTDDLAEIFTFVAQAALAQGDIGGIERSLEVGMDILEGNPVPGRGYSGFPLLHYKGPAKWKKVDATGNVDIHQIWYDTHIESDTAFLDLSAVQESPWTITYTVDILSRGHDDFSPFVIYNDDIGMDQTFFNMEEGTRTTFRIKMAPGKHFGMTLSHGWRVAPHRAQVTGDANKRVAGMSALEWERSVFCSGKSAASSCWTDEGSKLAAIAKIGDLSPAKRMWMALRSARSALRQKNLTVVTASMQEAQEAFADWKDRTRLPRGVSVDRRSDLTLFYVNNTIYGEFADGGRDFAKWTSRGTTFSVTLINGDYFQHAYQNVDFGGARGWENQFKSSVKVGGSGCWFTFGRVYLWANIPGLISIPPATANPYAPGIRRVEITYNYEPSRRLRFFQYDPTHSDAATFLVH